MFHGVYRPTSVAALHEPPEVVEATRVSGSTAFRDVRQPLGASSPSAPCSHRGPTEPVLVLCGLSESRCLRWVRCGVASKATRKNKAKSILWVTFFLLPLPPTPPGPPSDRPTRDSDAHEKRRTGARMGQLTGGAAHAIAKSGLHGDGGATSRSPRPGPVRIRRVVLHGRGRALGQGYPSAPSNRASSRAQARSACASL